MRLFKKETDKDLTKAKAAPSSVSKMSTASPSHQSMVARDISFSKDGKEDAGCLWRHPMLLQNDCRQGPSDIVWMSDSWWQGKTPAMEGYLNSLMMGRGSAKTEVFDDDISSYKSSALWAPTSNLVSVCVI